MALSLVHLLAIILLLTRVRGLNMVSKRLVLIGIGGASCSGKTLLAKHIRNILPIESTIIHQDDFAPPEKDVPYSPQYSELQDWDDPPTCVLWPAFRDALSHIKQTGAIPGHESHDHLNKQVEVGVRSQALDEWREKFKRLYETELEKGVEIVWFLVDGFVLYWDKAIVDMLDVRIFLRVPQDTLRQRREQRQTYVLQTGDVWVDPPKYFEKIVWPAYIKAHEHIFDGDIETGPVTANWGEKERDLLVVEPKDGEEEMTKAFVSSCTAIFDRSSEGEGNLPQ